VRREKVEEEITHGRRKLTDVAAVFYLGAHPLSEKE